jgi:hypothetical protein
MKETFQFDLAGIEDARKLDNYKIIEGDVKNGKCIVFFSGNGLYFPNTEQVLQHTIATNRYEWEKIAPTSYEKIIFIRDIYKQWYVHGINEEINSIALLYAFLLEEISGYQTTFIGSSAGGYAAVLLGEYCKADLIITLSGQFDLSLEKQKKETNKLLYEFNETKHMILDNLKNPNIIYFNPLYSDIDRPQLEVAENNLKITIVKIKSSFHGVPFYPFALKKVLSLDIPELKELSKVDHSMFWFSLKYCCWPDLYKWTTIQFKKVFQKIIKIN